MHTCIYEPGSRPTNFRVSFAVATYFLPSAEMEGVKGEDLGEGRSEQSSHTPLVSPAAMAAPSAVIS